MRSNLTTGVRCGGLGLCKLFPIVGNDALTNARTSLANSVRTMVALCTVKKIFEKLDKRVISFLFTVMMYEYTFLDCTQNSVSRSRSSRVDRTACI